MIAAQPKQLELPFADVMEAVLADVMAAQEVKSPALKDKQARLIARLRAIRSN